jgi:two-component system, response regulator
MSDNPVQILLVEDNPNDVELALHAFGKNGLGSHIQVARDGAEALDFLFHTAAFSGLKADHHPKVVLLDLKLPKIDGIEVLRQLKATPATRKLPVVVLTSSRQDKDIEECYNLGANSYLVKPIDFEEFMAAVNILSNYWLLYNQTPYR